MERWCQSKSLAILIGRTLSVAINIIGLLVGLAVIFPTFKASDLIQLLGVGGVAIGFAFKDIFQNFLAGVLILVNRPFTVGDHIVHGLHEGIVEDIQARATLLITYDNQRIVIPNTSLFTDSVVVTTAFTKRRSEYILGIDDQSDPEHVGEVISSTLATVSEVLQDPNPEVVLMKIGGGTLNIKIRWWINARASASEVQNDVLLALRKAFVSAEIKVVTPVADNVSKG